MKSQYLSRSPARTASIRFCYYCGCQTKPAGLLGIQTPAMRTVDHIHLASLGGYPGRVPTSLSAAAWIPIHNKRPCCNWCNEARNRLGHCCGMLMILLIEAEARELDRNAMLAVMRGLPGQARRQREVPRSMRYRIVRDALRFGV